MADAEDRLQFSRKNTTPSKLPIPVTPTIPEHFLKGKDSAAWRKYNADWDEWRKKLIFPAGTTLVSATGGGGGGTGGLKGERGERGLQGDAGVTTVIQQFEPPPYIPPTRDATGTRTLVWIAKRTDGKPGIGSEGDPYDGSTTAKLDALFRSFPINTTIHMGPGEFTTMGGFDGAASEISWSPKAGWRIIGAGMYVTTLKLVDAVEEGVKYSIIHGDGYCNGFQVMEITLDCDFDGQPNALTAERAIGAILVNGTDIYYYRVRAIHFGTSKQFLECFCIFNLQSPSQPQMRYFTADSCVIELPHVGNQDNVNGILVLGEQQGGEDDVWQIASTIRNCRFDFSDENGDPIAGGTIAMQMYNSRLGLIEGNVVMNAFRGVYWDTWNQKDLMIRGNRFYNCVRGCYLVGGYEFPVDTIATWERVSFIGNEVDLRSNTDFSEAPSAFRTQTPGLESDKVFKELFIERNLIRMANEVEDTNANIQPIYVLAADSVTIRENAIHRNVQIEDPIRVHNCTNIHIFDNRWNDLKLIQAYDAVDDFHIPELETLLDEATQLGLIGW